MKEEDNNKILGLDKVKEELDKIKDKDYIEVKGFDKVKEELKKLLNSDIENITLY